MTPKQQIAQLTAQLESRDIAIAELKAEIADLNEGLRLANDVVNVSTEMRGDTDVAQFRWGEAVRLYETWEDKREKREEKGCEGSGRVPCNES